MGTLIPLILMFAIFYFFLIRPQQKRQREVREMHNALQRGDKIVTIGGIHGTIEAIDEGTIIISVNDKQKLTFDREAVREVVTEE